MLASMVETQQQRERVESSRSGAAPRGIGPESGVHQSGATGRTATSTGGDTLGFDASGVRVGRGVVDQGLNPMYQMRIVPLFLQLTLVRLTGLLVGLQVASPLFRPLPLQVSGGETSPVEIH